MGLLGSELVSGIIPVLVSALGNYLPACSGHAHLPVLGQLPAEETSQPAAPRMAAQRQVLGLITMPELQAEI